LLFTLWFAVCTFSNSRVSHLLIDQLVPLLLFPILDYTQDAQQEHHVDRHKATSKNWFANAPNGVMHGPNFAATLAVGQVLSLANKAGLL
jgi:hypothetical protein